MVTVRGTDSYSRRYGSQKNQRIDCNGNAGWCVFSFRVAFARTILEEWFPCRWRSESGISGVPSGKEWTPNTDIVEILHHQHHTPIALQNRQVTQTGEEMSEGYYNRESRSYALDVLEPLESELGREGYPLRIP